MKRIFYLSRLIFVFTFTSFIFNPCLGQDLNEPNNTSLEATPIFLGYTGGGTIVGSDQDWYFFVAEALDIIIIEIESEEGLNGGVVLWRLGDDGNIVLEAANDNGSITSTRTSRIVFQTEVGGFYFIQYAADSVLRELAPVDASGAYSISLRKGGIDGDPFEPNNRIEDSFVVDMLPFQSSRYRSVAPSSRLESVSDVDYYTFLGFPGTEYIIYARSDQNSPVLDGQLELLTLDGTLIAQNDNRFQNNPGSSLIIFTPTELSYYTVRFSATDGQSGDYALSIETNADLTPPAITEITTTSIDNQGSVSSQNPVRISARFSDPSSFQNPRLDYVRGGESVGRRIEMTPTNNVQPAADAPGFFMDGVFEAEIPAEYIGDSGVFVRIWTDDAVLQDNFAIVTFPFQVDLQEGLDNNLSNAGNATSSYRIVSAPILLDDPSPMTVFEDDLGVYDDTQWRFFDVLNGADQTLIEYPNVSMMSPGRGFWLAVSETGKSYNTGAGKTIPLDRSHSIELEPGWNLIGNPFNYEVGLDQIALASNRPLDIRSYQGTWREHTSSLSPHEGYAVFSAERDEMLIFPLPGSLVFQFGQGQKKNTYTAASFIDAMNPPSPVLPFGFGAASRDQISGWSVRIVAESGMLKDEDNVFGMDKDASMGWDRFDRPEPPSVSKFVSVYFPHENWGIPASRFNVDVRPETNELASWTFEVRASESGHVKLTFDGLSSVPLSKEIWLVDHAIGVLKNLREDNTYEISGTTQAQEERFEILVGNQGAVDDVLHTHSEIPEAFTLSNFPNPFNPSTTINFTLPDAQPVQLTIYDVQGKQIVNLINGDLQDAGIHSVVWDGRSDSGASVASGMYLYVLKTPEKQISRSMLLVK